MNLPASLDILDRTPDVLKALLSGLGDPWISTNEGGETWNARDVIGHLLHGEETDWVQRARIILDLGVGRPFDPFDRFAQFGRFGEMSIDELLERFAELRHSNVEMVRGWNLTPEQLALEGTHPSLGTVTLGNLLATWVVHDLDHIAQIARVMARVHADQVGPWREYLRIINPDRQ